MTKIQLGGGLQSYEHPDYESIDIIPSKDVRWEWDLEKGLPKRTWAHIEDGYYTAPEYKVFPDNTVDEILAFHVLEHIHNLIPLMDELHDALKPDGFLHIKVPNAHHIKAAWSDPTHIRAFTPETFDYFTHATITAYPYTTKEWVIQQGYPKVNGSEGDWWEIEVIMRPVKK